MSSWHDSEWTLKPKRRPDPPKSPHGSWWTTASRESFTEKARQIVKEPPPFLINDEQRRYDA